MRSIPPCILPLHPSAPILFLQATYRLHTGYSQTQKKLNLVFAHPRFFISFLALSKNILNLDYGCALQKEILVQGRLFISENHVCFNANIFGWVTNVSSRSFFILSVQSGRGYRLHHASALFWLKDHSKIVSNASFFFFLSPMVNPIARYCFLRNHRH